MEHFFFGEEMENKLVIVDTMQFILTWERNLLF
jgi:hypothetical protein